LAVRVPRDLPFQQILYARPVVVDDRVPRRVADRVGQHHVLAEDALERRTDAEQRSADAQVAGVGLELDAHRVPALERVLQQEVLRLDVRAGAPLRTLEPGPADLRPSMRGLDVEVARRADRTV